MFKRILVFGLILLLLSTTGCWSRREPESYAWVSWIGLDTLGGEKIQFNIAFVPPLSPIPTGASPPEKLLLTASETGDGIFDAVRNINSHVPVRIFWNFLQATFISEDMARSGVEQYLDSQFRSFRVRKNAWVFITKGSTERLFKIEPQIEKNPSKLIDSLVKAGQAFQGKSRAIRFKDFQHELADPGFDPVVGVIGIWDPEEKEVLAPGAKVSKKSELVLDGSAVFRGDKLVGWLSPEDSQTYNLAMGELKSSSQIIPHPDNPQNQAVIETIKSSRKLKAQIVDGQVKANLSIKIKGNLINQWFNVPGRTNENAKEDAKEDPELYRKLGELLEQKLKSDLERLLEKAQTEFNADILGIGDYIRNRYPKDWEQIQSDWYDYYKKAEITVEVNVNVTSTNIMRPRYPKEDGTEQSLPGSGEE